MSVQYAYTLTEAKEMLTRWKDCEMQLASGQAKHYRIGSREFTSVDLPEIAKRITYFSNVVDALTNGTARKARVVRVVPRDL